MSANVGTIPQGKTFSLAQMPAWLWLGVGVFVLLLISGGRLLNDSDTYWQIAVGQWILDHAALPRVDIYSFTKAGEPWTSSSWLSQVMFAVSYNLLGWAGPVVLAAAAIAITFALLGLHPRPPHPFDLCGRRSHSRRWCFRADIFWHDHTCSRCR